MTDRTVGALRTFAADLRHHSARPAKDVDNIRTAVRSVLKHIGVEPDTDVRDLDWDQLLDQFALASGGHLSTHSISTYQNNFRKALHRFLRFTEQDPAWDTEPAQRPPRTTTAPEDDLTTLVAYAFPLRAGVTIRFMLPEDLTAAEANRLTQFIGSLVV